MPPELPKFEYIAGSFTFRAKGYPDRNAIVQLLQSFLEMCPPGARVDDFTVNGRFGDTFEIRAIWRVDPPQEVTA